MKQLLLKSKKSNLLFSLTEKKQVKKSTISITTNMLKCLFVVLLLTPFAEVSAQCHTVFSSSLSINSVATVTKFAGSGTAGNANGTRTDSSFSFPSSITAKASGNVFIPDFGNNLICVITSAGVLSTFPVSRMEGNSKYYRVINK